MSKVKIGTAGSGTMGASIAAIYAQHSYDVYIYARSEDSIMRGMERLQEIFENSVATGRLTEKDRQEAQKHISFVTQISDMKDCNIIIESIAENMKAKQEFWINAEREVGNDVIFATNTSGLSIEEMCSCLTHKSRFIGMHWFNPPHIVPLIEIIRNKETDESVVNTVFKLSEDVGKKPIICKKDVPGFIANRIQFAVLRECIHMYEKGVAELKDIDAAMKYGLGFRYSVLGPFEVSDLGGLDVFYHIQEYINKDLCSTKEPQQLIEDHFNNGEYGVKTKKGFYDYHNGKDIEATRNRDEMFQLLYDMLYSQKLTTK